MNQAPAAGAPSAPGQPEQQDAAQPDPADAQLAADADRAARASHDRAHARELFGELATLPEEDPQRQRVRDELVEMHLPLVEYLARRFTGRGVPLEDLIQVGSIGLLKAIDRFEPDRGLEFSTYATPTILGEIKRHFRDAGWLVHVPRRAQELQATLARARAELSQQLRRAPTVAELARHADVGEDQVLEAIDVARSYSGVPLDAILDPDAGAGGALVADHDVALDRVELREVLRPALEALPEREREILLLRFGESKTQSEIAEIVGVSQMQVSRLIARSLAQLRETLNVEDSSGLVS
jgi:RNA polymerase sigma-B factor